VNSPAVARLTADERRAEILGVAIEEFAARGLHGTSTEEIARKAGISQPYVFRLFGTKKELFIATVERCMRETLETFRLAAEGRSGEEALGAMAKAYIGLLNDRSRLMSQLQAYAACDDPEIRAAVRRGYGELVELVERVTGAEPAVVSGWFACGMLLNVVAAMDVGDSETGWARRLMDGIKEP
jgi:AcrR family transcriptional regulator